MSNENFAHPTYISTSLFKTNNEILWRKVNMFFQQQIKRNKANCNNSVKSKPNTNAVKRVLGRFPPGKLIVFTVNYKTINIFTKRTAIICRNDIQIIHLSIPAMCFINQTDKNTFTLNMVYT